MVELKYSWENIASKQHLFAPAKSDARAILKTMKEQLIEKSWHLSLAASGTVGTELHHHNTTHTRTRVFTTAAHKRMSPTARYNQLYWARDQRAREIVQRAKQCVVASLPREQGALRIGPETTKHFTAETPRSCYMAQQLKPLSGTSIRQHCKMNGMQWLNRAFTEVER